MTNDTNRPATGVVQVTFDGDEAPHRRRPSTLMWCPTCENHVLRSNRHTHPHDLEENEPLPHEDEDSDLEDQCLIDTRKWEVTFYYEMRETVVVEASHKSEAKTKAEHERNYDGEITHTLHDEKRALTDPSQATVDYLEFHGLLPDDHNVEPEDIEEINRRYDNDD